MITSILRYPGGKNKALPYLLERIPDGIKDWREPFFGGGSVSIGFLQSNKSKDCKKFVVGDLYPEVYHLWSSIQKNPALVKQYVYEYMNKWCPTHEKLIGTAGFVYTNKDLTNPYYNEIEQAIAEGKAFWEWASSVDTNTLTAEERAARFLIINRTSFSGMGDSGSMTSDQLFGFKSYDCEKVDELSALLQPLEILNASFEVTVNGVLNDSFIFFDAPYYQQSKTPMYGKKGNMHRGFPHEALAELCKTLPCKWLMTYDDSVAVRKLYNQFYVNPFKLTYTMAGNTAEDALAGEEVLISNYYKDSVDNDDVDMSDLL